jgi:competence protein ComEC
MPNLKKRKNMSTIHFLNVLQGDCNIIEHSNSKRVTVIDVCNADSDGIYEHADLRNAIYEDVSDNTTGNYGQKKYPENPIKYLERLNITQIWRFIVSHPDMDHLDGIRDLFNDFTVCNVWDTANNKEIQDFSSYGRFNKYDWDFYKKLRAETIGNYNYFKLLADKNNPGNYWTDDYIKILCPTQELVDNANGTGDHNDSSYVILFTPPIGNTGKHWKIIFSGDSSDDSWDYILDNFKKDVTNIDVLIAPHHGRDSDRNYDFLKTLNPRITLFGNASSKHLAYTKYSGMKITNNQAGSVIITCSDKLYFYVKNEKYRNDHWNSRGWLNPPIKNTRLDAYFIFNLPER